MSESDDGFRVAAIRQKAGRFLMVWGRAPGKVRSPDGTLCALSIVASRKESFAIVSHDALAAAAGVEIKARAAGATDNARCQSFMGASSGTVVIRRGMDCT